MCLPGALVIVIVKSRDNGGARFKYINVREESTMVAWLPQQILLLLVLVTAGSTHASEAVKWGTPSLCRNEKSSTIGPRAPSKQKEQGSVTTTSSDFAMPSKVSSTNIRLDRYLPMDDKPRTLSDLSSMIAPEFSHATHGNDPGSLHTLNRKRSKQRVSAVRQIVPNIPNSISLQSIGGQLVKTERVQAQLTSISGYPTTAQPDDSTMREFPWPLARESIELPPRRASVIKVNSQIAVELPSNMGIRDMVSVSNANFQDPRISKTNVELHSHVVDGSGHFTTTPSSLDSSADSLRFQLESLEDRVMSSESTRTAPMEVEEERRNPPSRYSHAGSRHQAAFDLSTDAEDGDVTSSSYTHIEGSPTTVETLQFDSEYGRDQTATVQSRTSVPVETGDTGWTGFLIKRSDDSFKSQMVELSTNEDTADVVSENHSEDLQAEPSDETQSRRVEIGHFFPAQNSLDSPIDSPQFQLEPEQDQPTTVKSTRSVPVEVWGKERNETLSRHSDAVSLAQTLHGYRDGWHRGNRDSTTATTTTIGFRRRYMRDAAEASCEKFEIGEENRREFYSPNYPQIYPGPIDCVRVLDAGEGMVLKLDFRDRFDMEAAKDKEDCKYDYLEVRDGQYGYANLLGLFCGKSYPPEITSKGRYLWLHFHSDDTIEYGGFKAIWNTVPRPTTPGVPPEPEPCIKYVTHKYEATISSAEIDEERAVAQKNALPLDCLWVVEAKPNWRMQLTFEYFKLDKPNDCDANFMDTFDERTEMTALMRNFCGSIAETVTSKTSTMFIRFYMEPKAINSTFKALMTAVRDKGSSDNPCMDDEYDCDDATCIAGDLRCNGRQNCRLGWDEDPSICGKGKSLALDSTRIVIILVIFALIMFGLTFAFLFNCIRKLIRDHRIIREHIRQSRENRLDEIGRKSTPCPISVSQTDIRQHGSNSPSLEIDSNKELIPTATIIAHEYTKDLVLEMTYNTKDIIDIHQSNNMSNATQERLQETTEDPQMCDSSCQTRESLFDPRLPDPAPSPAFSTFGYSSVSGSRNGVHPSLRQCSRQTSYTSPKHSHGNTPIPASICSNCSPATRGRDSSGTICPKHAPIPAPPGWSVHEPPYAAVIPTHPEDPEYLTYQRYQSPKPERDGRLFQPGIVRQRTIGSGEKYGSFLYGSERGSSNTASNTNTNSSQHSQQSQHSSTPRRQAADPRYRAEAVIEVDQKRPFSIESTKSAPDVIATH